MNDISELESELKKLRPAQPSAELFSRIARTLLESASDAEMPDNVIQPNRFRINWVTLGLGLAAAATFLLLAKIDNQPAKKPNPLAMTSPSRIETPRVTDSMVPAGLTEVVYHTRDEGLLYPQGSAQPVRRVRSRRHETLQWKNPQTGASLRVSYPSEEITLTPISGQ